MTRADAPLADKRSRFDVAPQYLGAADAIAALLYPLTLIALYDGGQMLRAASGWESRLSAWSATLGAAILVYSVPAVSFWIIYRLGQLQQPSQAQLRARASAHLAFASPPLFTAIGVLLYLLQSSSGYLVWSAFWLAILFATLFASHGMPAAAQKESRASEWVRSAHRVCALTILVVFLGPHIANHLTAIWSADLHKAVMNGLRVVYRSTLIQPAVVALVLFQTVSGGALLRTKLVGKTNFFGSLQTASGAYLAIFVISHLTAVLVLGRRAMQVDTNWDFAIGAPAGVMGDPWNVRLVPHYSLAVLLLFSHLAWGAQHAAGPSHRRERRDKSDRGGHRLRRCRCLHRDARDAGGPDGNVAVEFLTQHPIDDSSVVGGSACLLGSLRKSARSWTRTPASSGFAPKRCSARRSREKASPSTASTSL
jgi:hypothetical protein